MNKWTVGDIIDIVKEGIPFSKTETISVSTWSTPSSVSAHRGGSNPSETYITTTVTVEFPLEKVKNISLFCGDLKELFGVVFHPELMKDGNAIYTTSQPNTYNVTLFTVQNGKVIMELGVSLKEDRISATAQIIRDSNFYSLLDAALSD
jgi:hypothetical protein